MSDETLVPPEGLTPPEPLQAPKEVKPIPATSAGEMIKLDKPTQDRLDAKVREFTEIVIRADLQSDPFKERINAIHNMGSKEIRASAQVSNRILDRPIRELDSNGLLTDTTPISQSLVELRRTVEALDPSRAGDIFGNKSFLGMKMPSKVKDYFMKYQSSQSHINAIVTTLYRGQDELRKDNAAIEQEKINLWNLMQTLQQYIYVGKKIDQQLEARVTEIEATDPEKARIVREEMLFYVRQKVQDLLTQMAVNIQGYLALDMVRKNNLELVKGVDRATTTTVSALRTAVIVAQALANQKLVLDQITALNTTTSSLIEGTSMLLRKQTVDIHQQAASSAISIQTLQRAFANVYESMDMIATYKAEALKTMRQSINALSMEVEKAQVYLDRVRQEEAARVTGETDFLATDGEVKI